MAQPRPQLEAVLQRLLVVVLFGCVFHDNCVVSLADFAPLLGLDLPSSGTSTSWGGDGGSDTNFFKSSCKKNNPSVRLLSCNGYSTSNAASNLFWWARGGEL
jgi:hypothetical protein